MNNLFFLIAGGALLAAASEAFQIWRMRSRIQRMLEVIETFDLGDFEGRLAKASEGGGRLSELATGFCALTAALFCRRVFSLDDSLDHYSCKGCRKRSDEGCLHSAGTRHP